jgi:hypothetical protein
VTEEYPWPRRDDPARRAFLGAYLQAEHDRFANAVDGLFRGAALADAPGNGRALGHPHAIARFESEFAFLWDEIASESDDALLPQAQDLKRRLTRLVSSVREAA